MLAEEKEIQREKEKSVGKKRASDREKEDSRIEEGLNGFNVKRKREKRNKKLIFGYF